MVALTDSLVHVLGAKSAAPLEEFLGIRTVNDLLRHYPRKYSQGMTVLGEDTELPEEGDHVTFVDVITKAETRWTNRPPRCRNSASASAGGRRTMRSSCHRVRRIRARCQVRRGQ